MHDIADELKKHGNMEMGVVGSLRKFISDLLIKKFCTIYCLAIFKFLK